MADTTLDDTLVGQVLERRYQITSRLAQGGMATVYLALDTRLDRTVALKVMHPELARHDEFVARFIGEARSAARISHPNVVAVYDQGRDGSRVYLAMEYIAGGTLREELARVGRLTPRQMWRTMRPVLSALGAAHRIGMVHRDVKPENVLIATDRDGTTVKVADFGLARITPAEPEARTGRDAVSLGGMIVGTASYLSPEQVARGVSDTRSDVYSAGIMIYELLTGLKPFSGDDPVEVARRHTHADVPPPSALVPGLDPVLDALVARATSRDPATRPSDADALLTALDRACESLSDEALDLTVSSTTDAAARTPHESPTPSAPPVKPRARPERTLLAETSPTTLLSGGSRSRSAHGHVRWLGWTALVAVIAGAAAAGVWWFGGGRYVTTPSVLTLTQHAAIARLNAAGLHAKIGPGMYSWVDPAGEVVLSSPAPGQRVPAGGTVTLRLSLGTPTRDVPRLSGLSLASARAALGHVGLTVGTVTRVYDQRVPAGDVIAATPAAGTPLRPGGAVALRVSRGPHPIPVPNVVGMARPQAAAKLLAAGFVVSTAPSRVYSDSVPADSVVAQSASGQAQPHSTITLTISRGPRLYPVPNVTGMTMGDAKTALRQAGFTHISVLAVPLLDGNVLSQSPAAGTMKPHSATITLYGY